MSTTGGEKRPPSSPLESAEYKRKMDLKGDQLEDGAGGVKKVDNEEIIAEIKNCLPSLVSGVFDTNMAAMEERLTAQISNMTKRLEDKIQSANVSYNERFENMETVQDGFLNRLQDFEDRISNIESTTEKLEGNQEMNANLHDMLINLAKRVVTLEKELAREKENRYTDTMIEELSRRIGDLATDVRDKRICISGIKEVKHESPKKAVVRVLNELSTKYDNPTPALAKKVKPLITEEDIDIAYRTGKKIGKNPQNIVVHIKWVQTKMKIMALKKKLIANKQTTYFISEDIPFELRGLRQKLKNINEAAKKLNMESKIVGNKILLNGKMYTSADLDGLADDLLDGASQIKDVKGGLAYRGEEAVLSNFHHAEFILDDHKFVTVEQYYQYKKCLTLGKINMAAKILRTAKPLQAKALGDKFDDTDSDDWMEIRAQCMLNGTVAKFSQKLELANKLLNNGEQGLYEATTDKYFGAGVGLGSNLWKTGNWTGENAAGKICMNVRKLIKNELAHGANLENLAEIITYPVTMDRIPDAIYIGVEGHVDTVPTGDEGGDSITESESNESGTEEEEESEMETGPQDELLTQVETEPKETKTDLTEPRQENNPPIVAGNDMRKGNLGGGKGKRKSKTRNKARKSDNVITS